MKKLGIFMKEKIKAIGGHVIAEGQLMGRYSRGKVMSMDNLLREKSGEKG